MAEINDSKFIGVDAYNNPLAPPAGAIAIALRGRGHNLTWRFGFRHLTDGKNLSFVNFQVTPDGNWKLLVSTGDPATGKHTDEVLAASAKPSGGAGAGQVGLTCSSAAPEKEEPAE